MKTAWQTPRAVSYGSFASKTLDLTGTTCSADDKSPGAGDSILVQGQPTGGITGCSA